MRKKELSEEIDSFLDTWGAEEMISFFEDVNELVHLYNVDENVDWLKDRVAEEDVKNVRIVRTVYLMSLLAHHFAGKLVNLNVRHKDLWKRIEEHHDDNST